jgi:hypothetical protein
VIWEWEPGRIVRIDGNEIVTDDASMQPRVRTWTLADGFADSRMLFVSDPETLAEVVRTLAGMIPDEGPPLVRRRRAFWLGFEPPAPMKRVWKGGGVELRGSAAYTLDGKKWQLLDDLYIHGPLSPGVTEIDRAAILGAIGDRGEPFPSLDHAKITRREWVWDKRDDGQSDVFLEGSVASTGYQYGHDFGWTAYPVERVLTGAPDLYGIPDDVLREILPVLDAARR